VTLAAPPPTRVDRDEVFLEHTKSICPVCKAVIDAEINVRDNKVFIRKRCRDHGPFEALLYGDAEMYVDMQRFNKPGTLPLQTQTEVRDGCPLDCGLCPDHKQHACLGIIEVNTACNLDCPVCFADSGHQPDGFSLSLDQVEAGLDAFVAAEGEPEVASCSLAVSPPSTPRSSSSVPWPGTRACAPSCSTPTASGSPMTDRSLPRWPSWV